VAGFPKTGWLALTDKALVRVERVRFLRVPNEAEMWRVDAGLADPILLVRGVAGLKPGPIVCAPITGPEDPRPGDHLTIDLRGHRYRIAFEKHGAGVRIRLSDATRSQLLWSQHGEGNDPHYWVTWAGDIDGDGQLDLLVDFSEHYAGFPDVLLLSSCAKPGQLVGEAARFNHAAC
jgi:hypothetical protein